MTKKRRKNKVGVVRRITNSKNIRRDPLISIVSKPSGLHDYPTPSFLRSKKSPTVVYRSSDPDYREPVKSSMVALYSEIKKNPRVKICLRRAQRKEVIHATGIAGRRVSKPTFSKDSKVRC
nr:MAG: hypothetical protein [Microvirus sp.]